MIPFGTGIVTSLDIGEQIGATEGTAVWLAASYPLVPLPLNLSLLFLTPTG